MEALRGTLGKSRTLMLYRMRRVLSAEQRGKLADIQTGPGPRPPAGTSAGPGSGRALARAPRPHSIPEGGREIREEVLQCDSNRECGRVRPGDVRGHRARAGGAAVQGARPDGAGARRRSRARCRRRAGQQAGALAPTGKAQDLTMDEAVAKALQLNIDLSVERLNPQLQDLVAEGARSAPTCRRSPARSRTQQRDDRPGQHLPGRRQGHQPDAQLELRRHAGGADRRAAR